MLLGIISEDEVKGAVWNCDSSNSPGPDGFNFGFIKFCWDILKGDVVSAVQRFAEGGSWPKGTNASFITLVPKVANPQQLNDLRPISLVGCVYKIISKILNSRLKRVLNKVIDPRQSAFLEGRGLLDSVLVANETIEKVKRKKKECVVFKVDYEKVYDSVSWEFIYYMLGRLGFCGKWIEWIKNCLESSSISVLVNGSSTTEFKPLKGLRQWDPLAHFLFLIAAEGLVGVVRQAEEKMLVESIEVGEKRVKVSMVQYANDTLFFYKALIQSVLTLKAIMKCFELALGLKVNYSKSKVGGVGVNMNQTMIFASILNCDIMKAPFSYLGVMVGGNHKICVFWEGMLIKLRSRLSAWKGKSLSLAGRLCLIKSVLTSLPLFYVSIFCMPTTMVREMKGYKKTFCGIGGQRT